MAAKEMLPDGKISVVDSLSTSVGLQLMVETAVRAIDSGATHEEILDKLEDMREKMYVLFVVDTLEYLAKGGRIGNARAFLGTLLKVKPILILQDGAIEPLEQVRSKRKAQARMLSLIDERIDGHDGEVTLGLTHALVPEDASRLADQLCDRVGCDEIIINDLGPVIGTHTGPGVVGVAVYRP
jgi:DegV family protein with EDD domain